MCVCRAVRNVIDALTVTHELIPSATQRFDALEELENVSSDALEELENVSSDALSSKH